MLSEDVIRQIKRDVKARLVDVSGSMQTVLAMAGDQV